MAVIISRYAYAAHDGLPEIPGGEAVTIPDSLFYPMVRLPGVQVITAPEDAPEQVKDDLPSTAWGYQVNPQPDIHSQE